MELQLNKKQKVIQRILNGDSIELVRRREDVSRRAIVRWFTEFQQSGLDINSVPGSAVHRYQQLTTGQIKWLYHSLISKCPQDFGLFNRLWTRNIVQDLVKHWCLNTHHNADIYVLMSELGFEFINPLSNAYKVKSDRLQVWLRGALPQIYDEARVRGAQVLCLGEHQLRSSCFQLIAKEGHPGSTIIRQPGWPSDKHVVFAFDQHKKGVRFLVHHGVTTVPVAIDFIDRFVNDFQRPAFLIVQKNSSFSSQAFKHYARTNLPTIKIFTLPVKLA